MTEETLSNHEPLITNDAIRQMVLQLCPTAHCILSDAELLPAWQADASMLIVKDNPSILTKLLTNNFPSAHLPVLVLGNSWIVPDLVLRFGKKYLIDFLPLPINHHLLECKITFFDHIQRISTNYHETINTHQKVLDTLSKRDGLTGLFNRRHLTDILKHELDRANADDTDLCLLILNIDYFNSINKSSGLNFGDSVLNEMSARLTTNTQESDTCYRFSGEDFVVLMPQTDLDLALQTCENIRIACSSKPFYYQNQKKNLTVSIGVSSLRAHVPKNHDEFISMAETALYMAKASGRNRIQPFIPLGENEEYSPQQSLATLKETINRILEKTRCSTISSLQLLAKEIAGDEYKDHIDLVCHYVKLLGNQLGLPHHLINTFKNAITLHNSIRFFLHGDLFSKQCALSKSERLTMNDLPVKLDEITNLFDFFSNERAVLLSHHERYDGTGAPHGLSGNEIPLGARLFNIVDALAAMNSDRPFRARLQPEKIIKELIDESGNQFDPLLVLHTLKMIKNNHLLDLSYDYLEEMQDNLIHHFPDIEP